MNVGDKIETMAGDALFLGTMHELSIFYTLFDGSIVFRDAGGDQKPLCSVAMATIANCEDGWTTPIGKIHFSKAECMEIIFLISQAKEQSAAFSSDQEGESSDFAKLKSTILNALSQGSIVLLEGEPCTGKTFTLDHMFRKENILSPKREAIVSGNFDVKAIHRWLARTEFVAVDEASRLTEVQLQTIIETAAGGKKGMVLAIQDVNAFRHFRTLKSLIEKRRLKLVIVHLERFDSALNCPVWQSLTV